MPDRWPDRWLEAETAGDERSDALIAAALGTLTGEEACIVHKRLAGTDGTRDELAALADLRQVVGSLALLADEMSPSSQCRERIRQAIVADRRDANGSGNGPPPA